MTTKIVIRCASSFWSAFRLLYNHKALDSYEFLLGHTEFHTLVALAKDWVSWYSSKINTSASVKDTIVSNILQGSVTTQAQLH